MFMSKKSAALTGIAIAALSLASCSKKEAGPTTATEPAADTSAKDASARLETVLSSYETVRAELSRDEIDKTTTSAGALERAAGDAGAVAPPKLQPALAKLGEAAKRLKDMPKTDNDAVRREFGQVSEALVQLLSAEPSLRSRRYLYECPMAQGYKKWVQTAETVSNPYMGQQMPRCGTASQWEGS